MTLDIKICGLKTDAAMAAALAGGASHVGFIFFPKSPRYLAPDAARDLADALAPSDIADKLEPPDPKILFPFESAALTDGRLSR